MTSAITLIRSHRPSSVAATASNMGGLGLGLFLAALALILAALAQASMAPFLAGTVAGGVCTPRPRGATRC